jgi:hypothetical protein
MNKAVLITIRQIYIYAADDLDKYAWINILTYIYHITHEEKEREWGARDLVVPYAMPRPRLSPGSCSGHTGRVVVFGPTRNIFSRNIAMG